MQTDCSCNESSSRVATTAASFLPSNLVNSSGWRDSVVVFRSFYRKGCLGPNEYEWTHPYQFADEQSVEAISETEDDV